MSPIPIACPKCRDKSNHRARRVDGAPHITCLSCGHEWTRSPHDCGECGKQEALLPVRKPLYQKARGTQRSIIGFRIAKECSNCGWVSED